MVNVLISTLGLSPGVVTTAVKLLNDKPETRIGRVDVLYPEHPEIVQGVKEVLRPEFEAGGRLQGVTLYRRPMAGVYDDSLSQVADVEAFLTHFVTTLRELRGSAETEKLFVSISGGRKSMTYAMTWGLQLGLLQGVVVDGVWHVQIPRESPDFTFSNLKLLALAQRGRYLYPPDAILVPLPYQAGKPNESGIPVRHPLSGQETKRIGRAIIQQRLRELE